MTRHTRRLVVLAVDLQFFLSLCDTSKTSFVQQVVNASTGSIPIRGAGITAFLQSFPCIINSLYDYPVDIKGLTPGWYQNLDTKVGQIGIKEKTMSGAGGSAYVKKVGGDGAFFELRDYNSDGRFNTTAGGMKYVDSAERPSSNRARCSS